MNVDATEVKDGMMVSDAQGEEVAKVKTVEGDIIALENSAGEPRWIGFSLVERVDDALHLNVDEAELKRVWSPVDPNDNSEISAGTQ